MADNIKSLNEIDILFADFIQEKLNMQTGKVLISYQQKGQISSKIDEDVCYIKVFEEPDERHIWKNRKHKYDMSEGTLNVTQYTMRTLMLQVTFYGPNADNFCTKVNEYFYHDGTKQFLYENDLAFIPDRTIEPRKFYEKINEQWWQRSDLKLYFYNSISTEEILDTIESADIKYKYSK